jgi:MutS domain V
VAGGVGGAGGIGDVYRARGAAFVQEERGHARISARFSSARLAVVLAGGACLAGLLADAASPHPGWIVGAVAALALFVVLIVFHERVVQAQMRAAELVRINQEALLRLDRNWQELPLPALPEGLLGERRPPLARDLDLLGPASLFHLLGTAHTPLGKTALVGWLLAPAPPPEIVRRQEAVRELAPLLDLRQQLELRVRPLEKGTPDVEPFLRWAEGPSWLRSRPGLLWSVRGLALLTFGSALAGIFGLLPVPLWWVVLLVLVNLVVTHRNAERLEATFHQVAAREREFQLYAGALGVLAGQPFASPRLREVAAALVSEGRPGSVRTAAGWMDLLHRRVVLSDTRRAGIIHFPLQTLTLWDFHMVDLLERWQQAAGPRARAWLAALGDCEALAALAGLAHDNPGWVFPEVGAVGARPHGAPPVYAARALGHPLLPEGARVANDVEVGPPGTFLLVTGSNMSGKSTLLRAIGINAVLAQAGGPACAAALAMPPLDLATSILVEDSLADGVSFFLAELHRIRGVVDAAERSRAAGRTLLYLLDEVLRGTNSAERQVAVRRILLHLLAEGAIGAVSTHDLQLAEIAELQAASRAVHFRESFRQAPEGPQMTFDYRMREGVAQTVNALKLLEMVGLGEDRLGGERSDEAR